MTRIARLTFAQKRQTDLAYAAARLGAANTETRFIFANSRRFRGLFLTCCRQELRGNISRG